MRMGPLKYRDFDDIRDFITLHLVAPPKILICDLRYDIISALGIS